MRITQVINTPKQIEKKKAAVYARVSSPKDAALHSSFSQVVGLTKMIQDHADWEFAGAYIDEGISGTKENRAEFQRLLSDCRAGNINIIITKSVSRFARNTVVLLETVRELKTLNVDVYFLEQHIHTLSYEGEFVLTILASYAEEEAHSVSENMLWRVKDNFENGIPWSFRILGYELIDGKYVVKESEAQTVRFIFSEYLSGKGYTAIAKELNNKKIPTRNGPPWSGNVIAKILKNYNYTGNLLLGKTYREDFRTKVPKRNHGERDCYIAENTHEAIINVDTFNAVQLEMAERAMMYTHDEKTGFESFPFTGKIRCANCGKNYNRKTIRGEKFWICRTYNRQGKQFCNAKQIPEQALVAVTSKVTDSMDDIEYIEACNNNELIYHLISGETEIRHWLDRDRRDSWTPEMRAAARQQTLERMRKDA